jgi:hypothetical protein
MTPFLHKQEEKKCKRYSLERHYHSHAFGQSGACETQCIKTSIHFRIEDYLLKNDGQDSRKKRSKARKSATWSWQSPPEKKNSLL